MIDSGGPGQRDARTGEPAGLGVLTGDHDVQDGKHAGGQLAQAPSAPVTPQPRVRMWRNGQRLAGAARLARARPRVRRPATAPAGAATSADLVLTLTIRGSAGER